MRKSFREVEGTSKKGASRSKLAGCIITLMLLALTSVANPPLDTATPTDFFTNVAMAMFQQMDLHDFNGNLVTVTNIPIYEDPLVTGVTNQNYYTPAVHRILQLAANLFDATTNRFIGDGPTNYPTVFRPIFSSQNGIATIIGYQEVTSPEAAFYPTLNASDFVKVNQPLNPSVNMYGVPWVIGAKKGFPNFNQFSMENALTISRTLQFTNAFAGPPWTTNQFYNLTVTNTFDIGAWNSYTNIYGRSLILIASNELSITISNEIQVLLTVSNLPLGANIILSGWPGWSASQQTLSTPFSDGSFVVPVNVSQIYTNASYTRHAPFIMPISSPAWSATYVPRLFMVLENKLRYVLIDTTVNRVIDFVNIDKTQPPVDIASILNSGLYNTVPDYTHLGAQWSTNLNHGLPIGVLNQILVSENPNSPVWQQVQPNASIRTAQANVFNSRLANGGTNTFIAPYFSSMTIYQRIAWQANDPLVHYLVSDITSTNGSKLAVYNTVELNGENPTLASVGIVNYAYRPWGGWHVPYGSSFNANFFDFDIRVKDPNIQQSGNWNFPTGQPLSFEWLGRVHRGTPWQTVSLKFSSVSLQDWINWDNDNVFITNRDSSIIVDAGLSHPNNDWHLASLWARWLNTNDLSTALSINNPDPNAWAARLDGLTALTNSSASELDPLTITSNSPQAGIIAQAIQTARATTTSFQDVGDVLATPELSLASPFINTNGLSSPSANGLTDEALEKIPTQLLPLLRTDSFGKILPANGQLEMSFSGYDGHAYAIETSSNLTDWLIISTNFPSDGNFGITNTATTDQQYFRSVLLH